MVLLCDVAYVITCAAFVITYGLYKRVPSHRIPLLAEA